MHIQYQVIKQAIKSNSNVGYIFVQTTSVSKQIMISSCVKLPCTDTKNQLVNLIMVE